MIAGEVCEISTSPGCCVGGGTAAWSVGCVCRENVDCELEHETCILDGDIGEPCCAKELGESSGISEGVENATLKCHAEISVSARRFCCSVLFQAMKLAAASRRARLGS